MTISINYRIPDQPGARYNTAQRGPGPVLMIWAWPGRSLVPGHATSDFLALFSPFSFPGPPRLTSEPDADEINFRSDAIFLGFWNIRFINNGRGWVLWKLCRALDGACDLSQLSHSQQGYGLAPGPGHNIMRGGPDQIRLKQYTLLTFYRPSSLKAV